MPGFAHTIVDPEIDRIRFGHPKTKAAAAGRQEFAESHIRKCWRNSAETAKCGDAEPPKDAFERQRQAIFSLGRKHPAILVAPRRIAAQIAVAAVHTKIIYGNAVTRGGTTHATKRNHL